MKSAVVVSLVMLTAGLCVRVGAQPQAAPGAREPIAITGTGCSDQR